MNYFQLASSLAMKQGESAILSVKLKQSLLLQTAFPNCFDTGESVTARLTGNINKIDKMQLNLYNEKKEIIGSKLLYTLPLPIIVEHAKQFSKSSRPIYKATKNSHTRISRDFMSVVVWLYLVV